MLAVHRLRPYSEFMTIAVTRMDKQQAFIRAPVSLYDV